MTNQLMSEITTRLEGITNRTMQLVELIRQSRTEAPLPEQLDLWPKGRFAHRLETNDFERLAADHWRKEDQSFHILDFLMGDGNEPGVVSQRDRVVVATFVQWMGSNVGRAWVRELVQKFEDEAKFPGQA
jgi:hypothetical protein